MQGARVVAIVGELEPAGMAEHVRVEHADTAVGPRERKSRNREEPSPASA